MADQERSEDIYGVKVDRCLYNSMIKFVTGMGVGIVVSALFFKRKPWPVTFGAGIGIGMGIASCNYEFKYGMPIKSPQAIPTLLNDQSKEGSNQQAA